MNRTKLLMAVGVCGLFAAATAFAEPGTIVRANVPFSFYAGNLFLPPGSYVFTLDTPGEPGLLTIQRQNGREHELLLTVPGVRRREGARESELVFDRYGKDHFLSQIRIAGFDEERAIPKSEVERERAALLRNVGAPPDGIAAHSER